LTGLETRMLFNNHCPASRIFSYSLMKHLRVPIVDLLSFTQNLMHTHFSVLPSIAHKTKHEVEEAVP
jgi:hypothetical protein